MILSDLLWLPWQYKILDFKQVLLNNDIVSLYCYLKFKYITNFKFSEIVRPKMSLIDSSPLFLF